MIIDYLKITHVTTQSQDCCTFWTPRLHGTISRSKKFQDQYFIYHVVDVLKDPRITNSLSNPLSKIEKGEITMDPLIYQIKF